MHDQRAPVGTVKDTVGSFRSSREASNAALEENVQEIKAWEQATLLARSRVEQLEAIFLALFVLASQNRLARQADQRSHLNLQVDLLAEREMTAVLRLLQDIVTHLGVSPSVTPEQLRDLAKKTDLQKLTDRMKEFSETAIGSGSDPAAPDSVHH